MFLQTSKVIKLLQFIQSVIILTLNLVYHMLANLISLLHCLLLHRQLTVNFQLFVVFVHGPQSVFPELLEQGAVWVLLLDFQVLVHGCLAVVQLNFIVDQLLILVGLKTIQLKVKVETRHRLATRLIIRYMQFLHVGVRQSLLDSDTFGWVEGQHLLDKVDRVAVRIVLEKLVEVSSLALR